MNIQDELTQAIAEAAKKVISKKESLKDYKPTRGGKNQDDFIDLHAIDDKEDPEKEKQVEEKDEVEEGNEFTKAAAKAKLAGENEFEFKGKTYPVEIEKDAAEKILGKKEEVEKKTEELEENRAIVHNPRMIRAFIKQVEKKFPKYKGEIQQIEKDEIVFPNDDKLRDFFRGAKEVKFVLRDSVEIEEAIDPRKFVLGGDTKATKRDVDAILSKIFINAKLAKQVEDSEAYKAGYKAKGKGKNPYKKDTANFHLYILGQQSAQSE
jgi:hypothetical protein